MLEHTNREPTEGDASISGLTIRDARPEEGPAIVELSLAAYAQYADLMPHWTLYRELLISTLQQPSPAERIVAERDGRLAGHVMLFPADVKVYAEIESNAAYPELRMLAVAPDARGQGVGRALLEACIERARATGATALGLHTEDIMEIAQGMYERRGFKRVPELDFAPAPGVHVKAYRLTLS